MSGGGTEDGVFERLLREAAHEPALLAPGSTLLDDRFLRDTESGHEDAEKILVSVLADDGSSDESESQSESEVPPIRASSIINSSSGSFMSKSVRKL